MPTVTFQPSGASFPVPLGANLLEVCHQAGLSLPAACGGKGLCGKCRVRILEGAARPSAGCEHALSPAELAAGWRLACLVAVEGDMLVALAGESTRSVVLTDFKGRPCDLAPWVRAVPVELEPPTLADQTCDLLRLARAVGLERYPDVALPTLGALATRLRALAWRCTAVLAGDRLLGIEPYAERPALLGLAVDVGTTTIAGALIDLVEGVTLAVASRTNPQAVRGDDVVSRIEYAGGGGDPAASRAAREELQALVVQALREILLETRERVGAESDGLYALSVAGNTTMQHLLLGLDPEAVGAAPFIATALRPLTVRAAEVGLAEVGGALLLALPSISAYVGADIVAGLLAHGFDAEERTVILLDAGTNGEMALLHQGRILACATAAGPAFEGARISCGMRASTGAINAVTLGAADIEIGTVDSAPARGLCGTGLLDAVAVLLEAGILDETGAFLDPDELEEEAPELPPALAARVIEDDDGPAFVLARPAGDAPRVTLTQRDVREYQLAKAAIAAGIDVLLAQVGIGAADLDEVLLAGGFGHYLRPESALRTGLLPEGAPVERVRAVGNSSLAGARLALLDASMRDRAEQLARDAEALELSGRTDFQTAFTLRMEFPEAD